MGDVCRNCGEPSGAVGLSPTHCGNCPPWACDTCGEPCSMSAPCGCWTPLDGMTLADLKAVFADMDLSLDARPGVDPSSAVSDEDGQR